jgi:DNA-binding NarL/FixJ family response regulator
MTIAAIMAELKVSQVDVERQRADLRRLGVKVPDSRRTDTQAKVARLLDGGMKVAEIANKLGVSPEAIYLHRRQLKKV